MFIKLDLILAWFGLAGYQNLTKVKTKYYKSRKKIKSLKAKIVLLKEEIETKQSIPTVLPTNTSSDLLLSGTTSACLQGKEGPSLRSTYKSSDLTPREVSSELLRISPFKKNSDSYQGLAELFYGILENRLHPYWSPNYSILSDGMGNLMTAIILHERQSYFLKVVKPKANGERSFYELLSSKLLAEEGNFYAFVKPHSIIDLEYATVFVSPVIHISRMSGFSWQFELCTKAMAEMNSCTFNHNISLTGLARFGSICAKSNRVRGRFAFKNESFERKILRRHEKVHSSWNRVTNALAGIPHGISCDDAGFGNMTERNGKIVFFDMGAVKYSPLGADLSILLFEAFKKGGSTASDNIVSHYTSALKDFCGVSLSIHDVKLAAFANTVKKWLNAPSTVSRYGLKRYLYALNCAEYCISIC